MEIKDNLRKYYTIEAARRNAGVKSEWKLERRQAFADLAAAENKKSLLEIGAGTGQDSVYFLERGFAVIAIDLTPEMVRLCREKGVDAFVMDFYDLSPLGKTFDCVWAMNTLLHVPKADLPGVLASIDAALNPGGLFSWACTAGKIPSMK